MSRYALNPYNHLDRAEFRDLAGSALREGDAGPQFFEEIVDLKEMRGDYLARFLISTLSWDAQKPEIPGEYTSGNIFEDTAAEASAHSSTHDVSSEVAAVWDRTLQAFRKYTQGDLANPRIDKYGSELLGVLVDSTLEVLNKNNVTFLGMASAEITSRHWNALRDRLNALSGDEAGRKTKTLLEKRNELVTRHDETHECNGLRSVLDIAIVHVDSILDHLHGEGWRANAAERLATKGEPSGFANTFT